MASQYEANIVRKGLEKWETSVGFEATPNVFTCNIPKSQCRFTWDNPALREVQEKASIKFDIQGSTCNFRLVRTDTFRVNSLKTEKTFVRSDFEFLISDPDWDNNLSEFANLGPGQEVSWNRALSTFFSKPWEPETDDVNEGFYTFLDMVDKLANELRDALETQEDQVDMYAA